MTGVETQKAYEPQCSPEKQFQLIYTIAQSYDYALRLRTFDPLISLIIPWVTHDNSELLCALVSGTCFPVHGTLFNLHEHCP